MLSDNFTGSSLFSASALGFLPNTALKSAMFSSFSSSSDFLTALLKFISIFACSYSSIEFFSLSSSISCESWLLVVSSMPPREVDVESLR